jgi:hypothetical protein
VHPAVEIVAAAAMVPLALPLMGLGAARQALRQLVPPPPTLDTPAPDEANLLVHLLTEVAAPLVGTVPVRLAVGALPVAVTIGLRSGRSGATVTIGRGRVELRNGVSPDAVLVVDGGVETLLRAASGSLDRELRAIRVRPR